MRLALFDLDHTLIPFDSGMAWTRFLVEHGVLEPGADERYLEHCRQYVAGTLGVEALHRSSIAPLQGQPPQVVAQWLAQFEACMAPRMPSDSLAIVERH